MRRSEYTLPDGMEIGQVTTDLIELVRPVSPSIAAHFVRLQACKPFFDADAARINIFYECLMDDLDGYPEVAAVIALDDLRTTEGRYFPTIEEILKEVKANTELIFDALDFFQDLQQ